MEQFHKKRIVDGYSYVFVTNNGTFSVSFRLDVSSMTYTWVDIEWKNFETSVKMDGGGAEVEDVVKLTETNATDIQRVMTVEFPLSSQDGSFCVTKIFNSIPKA